MEFIVFLSIVKMWCHDGKVSLASFLSGIITTVFTSVFVLSFFSLQLNTFQNVVLCFIGPVGTYILFCVITYFVTKKSDFAVGVSISFPNIAIFLSIKYHFSLDNKKSNGFGRLLWTVNSCNFLLT